MYAVKKFNNFSKFKRRLKELEENTLQEGDLTINGSLNVKQDLLVEENSVINNLFVGHKTRLIGKIKFLSIETVNIDLNSNELTNFDTVVQNINQRADEFPDELKGDNKWGGFVLHDDIIYGIPSNASNILMFDTINHTFDTLSLISFSESEDSDKWRGGAMSDDGYIIGTPYSSDKILSINTNTTPFHIEYVEIPQYILEDATKPSGRWTTATFSPIDKLFYFSPGNSNRLLIFDHTIGTISITSEVFTELSEWSLITETASWSKRREHTMVLYESSSSSIKMLIIMGGRDLNENILNDVWVSTNSNGNILGKDWFIMNSNPPWVPRRRHASVILSDNSVVLIGGSDSNGNVLSDVWISTDFGSTWTQQTSNA